MSCQDYASANQPAASIVGTVST